MVDAVITTPIAVSALFGLGTAAGLVLITIGWRTTRTSTKDRRIRQRLTRAFGHRKWDRRRVVRLAVAAGAGLLAGVVTGWPVATMLTGAAVWFLPGLVGPDRGHTRRVARIEAVASWTEMLRDTLSAAAGLEQAILATAALAPAAIRGEVTALASRLENGQRLAPSLRHLADDLADPTADLVLAALVLAAEHQARQISDLLGSLATTAREQAAMRMRVETGRARTRTSVRVIVATTLAFAAGVVVFNRAYFTAYDTALGQSVLLGIGALFACGFAWLARIAGSGQPHRVLNLNPAQHHSTPHGTEQPARGTEGRGGDRT